MSSLTPANPESAAPPRPAGRPCGSLRVRTVCFSIQAVAEPGVMPRVLELFAKRSLVPQRWVSGVDGQGDLTIDLQVDDLSPDVSDYLARCLSQIADVRSVLTSEKARA